MLNSGIIIFILIVSLSGFFIRSLTLSGALASFIVGSFISFGFGIKGLALLGAFFLTSSLWSKYKRKEKASVVEITEKGERRDYIQVMANGSIPAICSVVYWLDPSPDLLIAFIISISAANSDTWASEIGSLSKKAPVHIIRLKKVEPGTSGAVSSLGFLASLFGAFLISILSYILFEIPLIIMLIIGLSGFVGSLLDTIIGATVQAKYRCRSCHQLTEKLSHCNASTILVSGKRWVNNDFTNVISIIIATLLGVFAVFLLDLLG